METLWFFLRQFSLILLLVLDFAMLIRAVLHWFDPMEEGRLLSFLVFVTEPVILPFRKLCASRHWFEGSPLDVPFFMAMIALLFLRLLVEAL